MSNPRHCLKHGGLRVLVTGARDYPDRDLVFRSLDRIARKHGVVCIIHGHCLQPDERGTWVLSGADQWAEEWAKKRGVPSSGKTYMVTRGEWKALGKRAGHIRNGRMIAEGVPDICVAFPSPESRGTIDCMEKCKERGILVWQPETNDLT